MRMAYSVSPGLAIGLDQLGLEPGKDHRIGCLPDQRLSFIVDLELVTIVCGRKFGILKTLYLGVLD